MIQNLEIKGIRLAVDDRIKRYVNRKIGKLDRYIPQKSRSAVHARVILDDEEGKAKNRFTCEVILNLPHGVLTAKESTINIYAAIDIAEAKLKRQLLRYKTKSTNYRHRARLFLRRVRKFGRRQQ